MLQSISACWRGMFPRSWFGRARMGKWRGKAGPAARLSLPFPRYCGYSFVPKATRLANSAIRQYHHVAISTQRAPLKASPGLAWPGRSLDDRTSAPEYSERRVRPKRGGAAKCRNHGETRRMATCVEPSGAWLGTPETRNNRQENKKSRKLPALAGRGMLGGPMLHPAILGGDHPHTPDFRPFSFGLKKEGE